MKKETKENIKFWVKILVAVLGATSFGVALFNNNSGLIVFNNQGEIKYNVDEEKAALDKEN